MVSNILKHNPRVYIILVNYNGWQDTIECIESILNNHYSNFEIIVVDNGSTDNSINLLLAWADGLYNIANRQKSPISFKSIERPIGYKLNNLDKGGILSTPNKESKSNITFVKNVENKGFAGANNIGISMALNDPECEYLWLLNNDTVICPDSLEALIKDFEYLKSNSKQKIGLLGSKLMLYSKPETIQAVGGYFNKYTTINQMVGSNEVDNGQHDFLRKVDYPIGASMFTSVEFVKDVGPMCEDFFLYYEELDWVERGKKSQWQAWNSYQSKIYHKHGSSTGQKSDRDFFVKNKFGVKGLIKYYMKHHKKLFILPYFRLFGSALKKLISGKSQDSYQIIKYIFD